MKRARIIGLMALALFILIFPILLSPNTAVTDIAVYTLIFMMGAVGWNIFSGYTGYISVGHTVYFGVGAYTLGLICNQWQVPGGYLPFVLLPIVGLVAGLFALPMGALILRTRKFAFTTTTIAFLFIFQLLAFNLTGITNGSRGIYLPVPPWDPNLSDLPFYYVAFILLVIAAFVSWRIRNSKYGLGLLAIRDDEDRASSLGISSGPYKLVAYVISAIFVGMAGGMFVYFVGTILPQFVFDPIVDVNLTTIMFLGGLGTLSGSFIGAILVVPLQQWLTQQFGVSSLNLVIFGTLLLVVLLVLPQGIVPSLQKRWRSRSANQATHPGVLKSKQAALAEKGKG